MLFVSDIVLTDKNDVYTWGYGDMLVSSRTECAYIHIYIHIYIHTYILV